MKRCDFIFCSFQRFPYLKQILAKSLNSKHFSVFSHLRSSPSNIFCFGQGTLIFLLNIINYKITRFLDSQEATLSKDIDFTKSFFRTYTSFYLEYACNSEAYGNSIRGRKFIRHYTRKSAPLI